MFLIVLTILVLVGLNALYVAAEFAAVSARRSRIEQLSSEGNRFARMMVPVLRSPEALDRYIAACQIGITITSLILGAYGQAALAPRLRPLFESLGGLQRPAAESTSAVVILISLTAFQMIIGELVPKSLALQFPTQVALYTAFPMKGSVRIMRPFIAILNGSGIAILKMLGMGAGTHRHVHSPEEIVLLIAESRDGGLLEPDEHQRLHRALRMGVRPVRQVMVPRTGMVAINVAAPPEEVRSILESTPYTRFPVYRGSIDDVLGFLHTRDFVRRTAAATDLSLPIEAMLQPLVVVPENTTVDRALRYMRQQRTHHALVTDEFGGTAGLVTLEDLITEIVGEFGDEFRDVDLKPELQADGRMRIPGSTLLDDVEKLLGVSWEGNVDTVGGRVVEELGRFPVKGERLEIEGVEVEVEEVLPNRVIATILARPVAADREDDI